jgi:hypothetical protein
LLVACSSPLIESGDVQALLGFWLMMPMPICMPAVALCRFSKHNTVARTVINTSAGFLGILLLSPLYDTYSMHRAKKDASHATPESLVETWGLAPSVSDIHYLFCHCPVATWAPCSETSVHSWRCCSAPHTCLQLMGAPALRSTQRRSRTCRTGGEANSLLSASLTAAAISNLFMLRHLGACIDEREKLRVRSWLLRVLLCWCCGGLVVAGDTADRCMLPLPGKAYSSKCTAATTAGCRCYVKHYRSGESTAMQAV